MLEYIVNIRKGLHVFVSHNLARFGNSFSLSFSNTETTEIVASKRFFSRDEN